jgi:hypothetical protein
MMFFSKKCCTTKPFMVNIRSYAAGTVADRTRDAQLGCKSGCIFARADSLCLLRGVGEALGKAGKN